MVLTDRKTIDVAETDEELLTFEVSDEALERAAPFIGGNTPVTMVFGTDIVGNCACPV